jgi:hypothetical protein
MLVHKHNLIYYVQEVASKDPKEKGILTQVWFIGIYKKKYQRPGMQLSDT